MTIKITTEKHFWTSEEKLKWLSYGEWVEEADSLVFEYLGYKALVIRILKKEPNSREEAYFGGYLCGYVVIPSDHPYFGKEEIDIDCHGELTFNESQQVHLIGFDCAHSGDYVPTIELMRKTYRIKNRYPIPEVYKDLLMFNPVYKNMKYCINQCIHIIDQLIIENEITKISQGIQDEEILPIITPSLPKSLQLCDDSYNEWIQKIIGLNFDLFGND